MAEKPLRDWEFRSGFFLVALWGSGWFTFFTYLWRKDDEGEWCPASVFCRSVESALEGDGSGDFLAHLFIWLPFAVIVVGGASFLFGVAGLSLLNSAFPQIGEWWKRTAESIQNQYLWFDGRSDDFVYKWMGAACAALIGALFMSIVPVWTVT